MSQGDGVEGRRQNPDPAGLPNTDATYTANRDAQTLNKAAGINLSLPVVGRFLRNGGAFYVDGGKPMPGLIDTTARNLKEVAPTIYFNVPRGYEALLPYLRSDETLRGTFFARLGLMQYAAAVLPQPVWQAYDELAIATCGERILWITGYGASETAACSKPRKRCMEATFAWASLTELTIRLPWSSKATHCGR